MRLAEKSGNNRHLIIMLHGTGGSAEDLFSIGNILDANATFVGIEGDVLENGMRRYFERYPDGSFNLESLTVETKKVAEVIKELISKYPDYRKTIIGYSNGANILTSIFKTYENLDLDNAILYHPSVTLEGQPVLAQKAAVLLTSGLNDPFITQEGFANLAREYRAANVDTSVFSHEAGHQLMHEELDASRQFLDLWKPILTMLKSAKLQEEK